MAYTIVNSKTKWKISPVGKDVFSKGPYRLYRLYYCNQWVVEDHSKKDNNGEGIIEIATTIIKYKSGQTWDNAKAWADAEIARHMHQPKED